MDWSLSSATQFLAIAVPGFVTAYTAKRALNVSKNQHQQQIKHKILELYHAKMDREDLSEKEKNSLAHIFYDYSKNRVDVDCLLEVLSQRKSPKNFENLAKVGIAVKYDFTQKKIVRSKAKNWKYFLAKSASICLMIVPAFFLIFQETIFSSMVSEYKSSPTTYNLLAFLIVYMTSFSVVIFCVYVGATIKARMDAISDLANEEDKVTIFYLISTMKTAFTKKER